MNKTKRFVIGLGGIATVAVPIATCVSMKIETTSANEFENTKENLKRVFNDNEYTSEANLLSDDAFENIKAHSAELFKMLERLADVRMKDSTKTFLKAAVLAAISGIAKGVTMYVLSK